MGFLSEMFETGGIVSLGLSKLAHYKWILIIFVVLASAIGILYWLNLARQKKKQWTHKIRVRRLLQNGTLTEEVIHKMRRFPLEKGVEMFELDQPIIGSYLIPQPGEYTGLNEFSIILDSYNRIWLNKGYKFDKDSQSINVSCVHAGIDVEMAQMRDKWQQAHKVDKKITTAELIQAGIKVLLIIAGIIITVVAIQEWGKAQQYKSQSEQAQAEAMKNINEATITMQKVVNTQQLQITPMLKALYGENNIANEINKYRPENITNGA